MRIIFIGPPGCGKGTQAKFLCDHLHLTHFSTGELIREAIALKTPAGQLAAPYVKEGQLAPDDLVNQMVAERFERADRPTGFVMDGYPRTVAQAQVFDQILRLCALPLDAVVTFLVDDEEVVKRLKRRGREDDKEAIVRERLRIYHGIHAELLDYYRGRGLLRELPGTGDEAAIHQNLLQLLGTRNV